MRTIELLSYLRSKDIRVWPDGDNLRYDAPPGALTPDLRKALLECKQEILSFLRSNQVDTSNGSAPILPVARERDLPLSFGQQRLWLLHQLAPASAFYNSPVPLRLHGHLDRAALQRSLNELVVRQQALRTFFNTKRTIPVQIIDAPAPVIVTEIDLTHLPQTERDVEVRSLMAAEARRPFDLSRAPLFRAQLFRLAIDDHVLLMTLHHIITDGWSIGVLVRELANMYEAFAVERPPRLPELRIQYVDFAVWQREWLQGKVLQGHLSYWKQRLRNLPTLQLPTDYPRPAIQSHSGAYEVLVLSGELTEGLKEQSRRQGATLFMLLLAAFKVLLHRYSGQEDIVVGCPIANRNRAEIEGLIGFFVNSLVIRTELSGNPSFLELVARVRQVALGAYAHQDLPFEKLVEELEPERDLSRNPLFQVMFAFQNAPMPPLDIGDLRLSLMWVDPLAARFDLETHVWEGPEGLEIFFVYSADLFAAFTIRRIARHFRILLEGIVANPEKRLSELPVLSEAERHQLLFEWNDTKRNYPKEKCVHQFFEEQAEKSPAAVAVVYEGQQLTYGELNRRANQLAHYLRKRGVGAESLVGICVERSLEMVVGLLGILKAGGAYVPLDPAYPTERLAFMLRDTQSAVVLVQEHLRVKLAGYEELVVCLDSDWGSIARQSESNPESAVGSEHLAYVIYTSGSTGTPKGTLVTHGNVARLFAATHSWFHFSARDVWTFFHSYAFDFSVWELWGALLYGGRVVVVPYEISRSPQAFYQLLCQEGVTVLNQTPSAFRQLMGVEEGAQRSEALSLRLVIFGGEALDVQGLRPWLQRHGDKRPQLVNMYGITETTVHVTYRPITMGDVEAAQRSPIGVPIGDLQVYLLDTYYNLVPVGVAGEMYVGGEGVARGYLNRAELSAERFVPNPFSDKPGARLYRTGDLARISEGGELEFLGRVDHQVKIRGYRIELGEVEAVLGQHPGVREAVVVVREHDLGDKRLVAYVVAHLGRAPSVGELRGYLRVKLPEYMLPSALVVLDALPLTENGKVDRNALPDPNTVSSEDAGEAPPETELEQTIAAVWKELLKSDCVGVHSNFFDLGGHSILLAQAHAKLSEITQREIPMIAMFQFPTISSLAGYLSQEHTAPALLQQSRDRAERRKQLLNRAQSIGRSRGAKEL
jgi:amino acid adenylation domain-containing protein